MYKLKVNVPYFGKYNIAEFTNLVTRLASTFAAAGENYAAHAAKLAQWKEQLQSSLAYSRAMPETAALAAADKALDKAVVYLIRTVKSEQDSPTSATAEAAKTLYGKIKMFTGAQNSAYGQQSALVDSLLKTLNENTTLVTKLNLVSAVEALTTSNAEFAIARDTKSAAELNTIVESVSNQRPQMNVDVEEAVTKMFADSISVKDFADAGVLSMVQQIIGEAEASYKARKAKAPATEDKPSEETPDEDEPTEETPSEDVPTDEPSTEGETPKAE